MLLLEEYHTLHACVTTWKSGLPIMSTDYQSTLPFGRVVVPSCSEHAQFEAIWCYVLSTKWVHIFTLVLHFWKRRLNAENNSLLRELADGLCYMTRPALLR